MCIRDSRISRICVEVGKELTTFSGMGSKKIQTELNLRQKSHTEAVNKLKRDLPGKALSANLIRKCRIAMDMNWTCLLYTSVYGGTYNLFANTLADAGIETTFVDARDVQNFSRAIRNNTKALYVESLGNPNCDIVDMEALAEVAHAHGIPLIVDSTFATPFLLSLIHI